MKVSSTPEAGLTLPWFIRQGFFLRLYRVKVRLVLLYERFQFRILYCILYILYIHQKVSGQLHTVDVRVRPQTNPYEICGGQSGNWTGFFSIALYSPANYTTSVTNRFI